MIRRWLLNTLLSVVKWMWSEALHYGEDELADDAVQLIKDIRYEYDKLS